MKRRKDRLSDSSAGCIRRRSESINDLWSYDFVFDWSAHGRPARILTMMDEHTRKYPATHTARGIRATDAINALMGLMAERGGPNFIRSDNGPEPTAMLRLTAGSFGPLDRATTILTPGAGCLDKTNT